MVVVSRNATYHFNRGGTIGVGYLGVVVTSVFSDIDLVLTRILDTLQEVLAVHAFYFFLVDNFDNPLGLLVSIWSLPVLPYADMETQRKCVCDNARGHRQCRPLRYERVLPNSLVGSHRFPIAICSSKYIRFCALNVDLITMEVRLKPFGSSGLALEVTCDLLISSCMTYYLQRERRNGLRRSGDILSRLILLTVATGMLSTLVATADLIAYLTSPDTFYVLFFNFLIAKVDANALLTSLNSRQFVREGSGPSAVCIHNDPKTMSCTLSTSHSAEECRTGGERAGTDDQEIAVSVAACAFFVYGLWSAPLTSCMMQRKVVDEPYLV
ncbi:hypothetical protein LXA43DRAFT_1086651 [Ganoderma leucocontextum]|nr:hypothetical protein LXA43DRAFT_1086651 [Ganoderma leucocontextum]